MAKTEAVLKRAGKPSDIIGKRFGRLVVESISHRERRPNGAMYIYWKCRCDCGGVKLSKTDHLKKGETISCGCARREMYEGLKVTSYRHGHCSGANGAGSSTYTRWVQMVQRCTKPTHPMWKHYGARGINVCEAWLHFPRFLRDMGEAPKRTHLDRINNDGNYEPGNCRWASYKESGRNKRTLRLIEFNGETKCVADWADHFGIKANTIRNRLLRKFPIHRLFTKP